MNHHSLFFLIEKLNYNFKVLFIIIKKVLNIKRPWSLPTHFAKVVKKVCRIFASPFPKYASHYKGVLILDSPPI